MIDCVDVDSVGDNEGNACTCSLDGERSLERGSCSVEQKGLQGPLNSLKFEFVDVNWQSGTFTYFEKPIPDLIKNTTIKSNCLSVH